MKYAAKLCDRQTDENQCQVGSKWFRFWQILKAFFDRYEEYRVLSWFLLLIFSFTYFSFVSGISLLGTSTEIYVYGTQYAFILITLAISGLISWYIFLPVFCNLQLTSTYEVSCTLAESWLRLVCVVVCVCTLVEGKHLFYISVYIFILLLCKGMRCSRNVINFFGILTTACYIRTTTFVTHLTSRSPALVCNCKLWFILHANV